MNNKQSMKELIQTRGTLAQQLHQIRISKQLTMQQVCAETGVPGYLLDNLELGRGDLNLGTLYILAKYYGRRVQISLLE